MVVAAWKDPWIQQVGEPPSMKGEPQPLEGEPLAGERTAVMWPPGRREQCCAEPSSPHRLGGKD